jgi:PKD repeat protein
MKRPFIPRLAVATGLLTLVSACTMHKQEAPPLTGPSEFAQSVTVAVSPDVLSQDGASQSLVTVTARDANSQPLRNLTLRVEIRVGGTAVDFGSLSARSIVTANDGRATLVYTAPSAPPVGVDNGTVVDIIVTPVGADFNNSSSRGASIRLVPPGVVIPPDGLVPAFTTTPSSPQDNQPVLFDASTSQGTIVDYRWDFGDGRSGSGRTVTHVYDASGPYAVTLTIVDPFGRAASKTQTITVGAGTNPTALFVVSPTPATPGQTVFFNAAGSRTGSGRTIVSYRWDFGDGTSGAGQQTSHVYAMAGTYAVTLVITDNAGARGTVTNPVTVEAPGSGGSSGSSPTADFTFAPPTPSVGAAVNFNAGTSKAATGRTITAYSWNFGDNTSGSGVTVSHPYTAAGIYNVILTVVDDQGKTGTVTKPVTVQ